MISKPIKRAFVFVAVCQLAWILLSLDSRHARQLEEENELRDLRDLNARSTNDNLVVYNAIGKAHNLALVEHSRRTVFKPDEWDCVGFMYAKEDRIPDDDPHLRRLIDELGCVIIRAPGTMWGDFLQYITPIFVSNYEYIALVLDDIFIPDRGPHAVDANKMLENMKKHDIHVMTPGIVGDTYNTLDYGVDRCIVELKFIETYVQIFTRDAWECYYSMLHYTGSRGWCYDVCFKGQCPDFRLGQDFSMLAWHMDRGITELPQEEVFGTDLVDWAPEVHIEDQGYFQTNGMAICGRLGCQVSAEEMLDKISCPASEEVIGGASILSTNSSLVQSA
jgi:hypothetical protein